MMKTGEEDTTKAMKAHKEATTPAVRGTAPEKPTDVTTAVTEEPPVKTIPVKTVSQTYLTTVYALVVALGLGFAGGVLFQRGHAPTMRPFNLTSNNGRMRNPGFNGPGAGSGSGGGQSLDDQSNGSTPVNGVGAGGGDQLSN